MDDIEIKLAKAIKHLYILNDYGLPIIFSPCYNGYSDQPNKSLSSFDIFCA